VKLLPSALVLVRLAARLFRLDLRRLLEALRLVEPRFAVPFLLRVLHAFFAAALREALVERLVRLEDALRLAGALRLEDALRLDAPRFAALLLLAALRLRVLQAFLAAALREAFVERLEEDALRLEDAFRLPLRAFRLRVAAAFLPAAVLFALLRRRVAAAFFAAALREALEVLLEVDGLRLAFLFRVAAAFFAAEDLFAAFLFRVAAAFFAAADLDAFVPFLAAIFFDFPLFLGGFTNIRLVSAIDSR
jgi:hypothetical protein